MNASAEEFRKITMKVLVMQLASTTIMDLVAYGGAGAGIALSVRRAYERLAGSRGGTLFGACGGGIFLPLRSLGSAFHVAMNGASAGRKIISLLNLPDPVWGKNEVTGTQLKLENVTFSYDGKRDVLKNVSMTFPEKGMTAHRRRERLRKEHRSQYAHRGVPSESGHRRRGRQTFGERDARIVLFAYRVRFLQHLYF